MPRRIGWGHGFRFVGLGVVVLLLFQWYRTRRLRMRQRYDDSDEYYDDEDDGGPSDLAEDEVDADGVVVHRTPLNPEAYRKRKELAPLVGAADNAAKQRAAATAALLGKGHAPGSTPAKPIVHTTTTPCAGRGVDDVELSVGLRAKFWCGARSQSKRLFVAITSPVGNFNLRKALRNGQWLMRKFPPKASFMFFVGTSYDANVQKQVATEIAKYGDVVQFSFLDSFHNLAVKSFGAAAWAASQLDTNTVRYWLKVEDFMTNKWHLIDALVADRVKKEQGAGPQRMYYAGGMIFGGADVIKDGRWGCPKRHCPYKKYPVTYAGGQYMLSISATTLLALRGARGLNLKDPYPIEDHYVAQTLLKAAGVKVVEEKSLMWWAGKPYGAPSVVEKDFLLCLDTENRPTVGDSEDGIWEGGSMALPVGGVVQSAWYGNPATKWTSNGGKDVTEYVRKALKKKALHIKADGALFGDPAPGVRKVLLVRWAASPGR